MEAVRLLNFLREAHREQKISYRIIRCHAKLKQLAFIKIPEHSKAATMKAKGNHLADAAASQAALNSQIIQT